MTDRLEPSESQADAAFTDDARPIRLGKARAALVVYRIIRGEPRFLLISSARTPEKLTLPGGKIAGDETPQTAAVRETEEEAGVMTHSPIALGQYLHRKRKHRVYPTQTYLAPYAGTIHEYEDRTKLWLSLDELADPALPIRKPIRRQLKRAARLLADRSAVA